MACSMYSNINLSNGFDLFKYVVEIEGSEWSSKPITYYYNAQFSNATQRFTFYDKYVREGNIWTEHPQYLRNPSDEYIPTRNCDHYPIPNGEVSDAYENPGGDDEYVQSLYAATTTQFVPSSAVKVLPCGDYILSGAEVDRIYKKDYKSPQETTTQFIYKTSKVRVYFPGFSIDVYRKGIKYALDINVWIGSSKVDLGSFIFNRSDVLACADKKLFGDTYCEYIEFEILDPKYLLYSDNWKEFRENVCNEVKNINITESPIYISLYPIEEYDDHYIMADGLSGGQNSISVSDEFLSLHLTFSDGDLPRIPNEEVKRYWKVVNNYNYILTNIETSHTISESEIDDWYESEEIEYIENDDPDSLVAILTNEEVNAMWEGKYKQTWAPTFRCVVQYNEYYDSLEEYIQETYGVDGEVRLNYELALRDNDNIYWLSESNGNINKSSYKKFDWNIFNWNWYNEYINTREDGLYFQCIATIMVDGLSLLYIRSNKIPVTQDLFKYLVFSKLKFADINMELQNINIINKTVNEIIQVDNPTDSKSNIIQPVFFRAREAANIVVHPRFTENISINLNAFKSKVDKFIIQIEGVNFTEIGRIASGIIFKIVGTKLPGKVTEGTYYVLNEDGEGVTTGKYIYE